MIWAVADPIPRKLGGDCSRRNSFKRHCYQLFRTELSNAVSIRSTINGTCKISGVHVGTEDSFQGQETDLVIFLVVRSNLLKEMGFLRDDRRLNVAITRARRGLIVVGDPTVLRTCRHWEAMLDIVALRNEGI
jgi:superfamily I DNA and/or RNA helicase